MEKVTEFETEKSNIDDEEHPSIDHIDIFRSCLNMYMIAGIGAEDEEFETMDEVTLGIKHYKSYSRIPLIIEKTTLGCYCP